MFIQAPWRVGSSIAAIFIAIVGTATLGTTLGQDDVAKPGDYITSPADADKRVEALHGVVSSANALASDAGVETLRAGGNAVDAAVAAAFAIGVVEPQMSGLGGSGAATLWMESEGKPDYLDFYASQPADAWVGHTEPTPPPRSVRASLSPSPVTAREPQSGSLEVAGREPGELRRVGIPGTVAGLLAMHERYGVLGREQVMAPAIRLAEDGFPVGQVLADFIAAGASKLKQSPEALALLSSGGKSLRPGEILKNPELAAALRRIAIEGRNGFYRGVTADALIATINKGGHPAGLSDLSAFEPRWKRPLCTDYRGFTILSAPPPQTGFQVLHTLELLEPFNLKALGLPLKSPAAFDVLTSALRVAQAEVSFNTDPNWAAVPANGLSSARFAETRKALVGTHNARAKIEPGDPSAFDETMPPGECARLEPYGPATPLPSSQNRSHESDPWGERAGETDGETTHLAVVDRLGNAVSLTTTNSSVWGSGGFVSGFFLNDSGFRFTDENISAPSRSRSRIRAATIAPTLVLKGGAIEMVIGAPGGSRIPSEIVQVMVYVLDYELDPLEAVKLPRIFASANTPTIQVEHGFTPQLLRDVRSMGYDPVAESSGYARLYLIVRGPGAWIGVADPRHDGEPRGY